MAVSPNRRRVVVTGMGVISACGQSLDDFWSSLITPTDAAVAGSIDSFDPTRWMDKSDIRRTDDRVQFAVAAAMLAFVDAGTPILDPLRAGVIIGVTHGAASEIESAVQRLPHIDRKDLSPHVAVLANDNMPAAMIAMRFGATGTCQAVGAACASGTYAIVNAARLIESGVCDLVFAGGTAGALSDVLMAAYENLRVFSRSGLVRPFDVRREGFVYSPGAAVLILESSERARARGARVYGEVAGWATTNDASHAIRQDGIGAAACMREALRDAAIATDSVTHVNAHGTATMLNDQIEAEAIRSVFPSSRPSVTSIKRVTGHSFGAAGAFEAVSVLLSFQHHLLPPAGIDAEIDESLGVDVVVGVAREWKPSPTISNSFGLGGQNGTIVMTTGES